MQGKDLQLALGFSHEVVYETPDGITIACPKPTEIVDLRHRQASRSGRWPLQIRKYRKPRALQGQGRQICRRADCPQRRQEEVRIDRNGSKERNTYAVVPVVSAVRLKSVANGDRARLSIYRSSKNIYAQIIDDQRPATRCRIGIDAGQADLRKGSLKDRR